MSKFTYFFFLLRLSFLLFVFLVKTLVVLYPQIIAMILTVLVTAANSLSYIKSQQDKQVLLPSSENKYEWELLQTKVSLEKALKTQPTHQEILLNLSRVEKELSQQNAADKYFQTAQKQNPNSTYFSED